jgi:hypothetical protein
MRGGFIRFLEKWVVPITGRRRRTLTLRVDELFDAIRSLPTREEFDALKSSLEVPSSLVEEFDAWRSSTPVPESPLVTICIATYNRASLLMQRALPSVLGQTYRNIEVIVVGDACTDDTEARVTALSDPRLRFFNLRERGRYPADPQLRWMVAGTAPLNAGLRAARGDYITHLDDDDEFLPQRIERLVDFAREQSCDFVWHPFWQEVKQDLWLINEAVRFEHGFVTTSSVFYRSWLKRIEWDINAWRLREPGDWNRMRKIRYLGVNAQRFPEPLLRHFRERNDATRG